MATRTSPELSRARCVWLLVLGVEVASITSATVDGNQRVARDLPLLVALMAVPKFGHPQWSLSYGPL
eukprot:14213889-Alexandrium_andersonii.AAC.1